MSDQASTISVNTIEPQSGTTLTVGKSGQNVVVNADSIKNNVLKDAGGNAIWTSNGSGVLSGVNAGFGSAQVLLSTTTVSTAVTDISFTSGIDSTYKEYVFEFINLHPSANNASFTFNGSSDGGSNYNVVKTTTLFYAEHNESGANNDLGYDSSRDLAQSTGFQILNYRVDGASSDGTACGCLHLFAPSSTTYVKNFYSTSQYMSYDVSSTYSINPYGAGYFNTTSAVDAIRFQMDSGNIDAGKIKMYGIK